MHLHGEAGVVLRSGTGATAGVAWATKLLHLELGARGEVGTAIGRAGAEDRVTRTRKTAGWRVCRASITSAGGRVWAAGGCGEEGGVRKLAEKLVYPLSCVRVRLQSLR